MEFGFILFVVWTYFVFKIGSSTGRLNGSRDGARALARYIIHFNLSDSDSIENAAEQIEVEKVLAKIDKGGVLYSSYGKK